MRLTMQAAHFPKDFSHSASILLFLFILISALHSDILNLPSDLEIRGLHDLQHTAGT